MAGGFQACGSLWSPAAAEAAGEESRAWGARGATWCPDRKVPACSSCLEGRQRGRQCVQSPRPQPLMPPLPGGSLV